MRSMDRYWCDVWRDEALRGGGEALKHESVAVNDDLVEQCNEMPPSCLFICNLDSRYLDYAYIYMHTYTHIQADRHIQIYSQTDGRT